jgi:hypothetical protein
MANEWNKGGDRTPLNLLDDGQPAPSWVVQELIQGVMERIDLLQQRVDRLQVAAGAG